MIPILYEPNVSREEDLVSSRIGHMGDCVSASCRRILNGVDELEIVYPMSGLRASEIATSEVIMAQPEYEKSSQPYRIYQVLKQSSGLMHIYARHIKEQTSYIPVMPFSLANATADAVYTELGNHLAESVNPFTFWTDISTQTNFSLSAPASLLNILGGMEGSLLDNYGGEYEFDGWTIKLWQRRGADNGVELRYGKNIKSAKQEESIDRTITGILPFWKDMDGNLITLPEEVIRSQNAQNFPFNRTVVKDFSDIFDEAPTVAQLRAYSESYIAQSGIGVPEVSIDIDFEHLAQYEEYQNIGVFETVNLGDTVTIIYEHLMGIRASARVVETRYDVLNERYKTVGIGKVKYDLIDVLKGR